MIFAEFMAYIFAIAIVTINLWPVNISGAAEPIKGDSNSLELPLLRAPQVGVIFYGGFEEQDLCAQEWKRSWGIGFENRCPQIQVLKAPLAYIGGRAIRVGYPKDKFGTNDSGAQFPIVFGKIENMPPTYNALFLRYYVKFEEGFDFKRGGKLPGLMGGGESWKISGGNQSDGTNGWTMRLMWRDGGKAVVYGYLAPGKYQAIWGYDFPTDFSFAPGKWTCIEQQVIINDIGKENGVVKVWINNAPVLTVTDIVYRTVDNDAGKIGGVYFSTFHGGNDTSYAPSVDSWAQFDGLVVSQSRAGLYSHLSETQRILLIQVGKEP